MANSKPADRMKELVTVTLPRATGREEDTLFVGLNGKGYNIKKGVPVRVPRPVYEILVESRRQDERRAAYSDKLRRQAADEQFQLNKFIG